MNDTWTIYTDGGARGNPGPAAYAYVIKRPGAADIEEKRYLGKTTNNVAEYTGLVKALEHAKELGGKKLIVNSDSELMVKQLNGDYRVKNEGLKPLYQQAVALCRHFESVTIKHIYREQNSQADALCNEAMDDQIEEQRGLGVRVGTPASAPPVARNKTGAQAYPTELMIEALDHLTQSAERWAEGGDSKNPPPAVVLNRIVEIMRRKVAE